MLAAMGGRSAVGLSQMYPPRDKLHPREIYAGGGGLLAASINAAHCYC